MNSIKNTILVISLFVVTGFCSCKEKSQTTGDHPILKASLDESPVSIFDIFKKIEIIPLETNEESIFRYTDKIEIYEDKIFIFDRSGYALLKFDLEGNYIDKIKKIGRGPDEYIMAYDFIVNKKDKTLELLNPMGSIHKYDYENKFITMGRLPVPPPNYRYFEKLNDDSYVTWSSMDADDERGVNIIDAKTLQIKTELFPYTGLWGVLAGGSPFNKYNGDIYYRESMTNQVYLITRDGYKIAYEWDLGVEIIDPKKLMATPKGSMNDFREELFNDFKEGRIPFFFDRQLQSKDYYFTSLNCEYSMKPWKYLFYDKTTGKSMFFHKTTEGIDLIIQNMTEDYAIGVIMDNDTKALQSVVSESDAKLLAERKDDDNWWLVKYTFK